MKTTFGLYKYTFLFFFFSLTFATQAQHKHFQDGFVVTTKKDTLVGKLSNIHKNAHNYIDFQYPDKTDTIFTPDHISSYVIGDHRFEVVLVPHPTKTDTTYLFAEIVVDGYANLYKTKLKVDPITAAEEAYLCKKYNESTYYPAGRTKSLAEFFSDYPALSNELKINGSTYDNTLPTKIKLFNRYNEWKKTQPDTAKRLVNIKVEQEMVELYLSDHDNLSSESKYELYKIAGILSEHPDFRMVLEFVNGKNPEIEKIIMKAVLLHLNEYDARIDEKTISIPTNQQISPTRPNGQIVFYYFR